MNLKYKTEEERKEACRGYAKKYAQSEKGKATIRRSNKKYKQSEHGKVIQKKAIYKFSKKQIEELGDWYIRGMLSKKSNISRAKIPQIVIDAKRANLQLYRSMRSN